LVRRLLTEAAEAVSAPGAALWMVSEDWSTLDGTLATGPGGTVIESAAVPVDESVVGMVAGNGLATSIGPDDFHNTWIDELTGLHTRAMVAAPVLVRGQVVGVVSAINPGGGGLFSADDIERISWKAYLIGLVLADSTSSPRAEAIDLTRKRGDSHER
jgi:GAF domain-containing protein